MIRRRYIVTAALISALLAVPYAVALVRADLRYEAGKPPLNIAHRGASARAPENTLEAFRLAREAGADVLEMDLHMSRDGRLVVIHDPTVDRTTDGSGAVRHMSLQEIRALDAGHAFTPGGIPDEPAPDRGSGEHPYRGQGVRAPTFSEVLEEFPRIGINVEIKGDRPGIERAVLREIERAGAADRVLVASQDSRVIRCFRELSEGKIDTAASTREVARFYALSLLRLKDLADPPYEALQIPIERGGLELATPRLVEAAHSRGVRVDVWTVDDPKEMRRLLDLGADSIITNRPAELQEILENREG